MFSVLPVNSSNKESEVKKTTPHKYISLCKQFIKSKLTDNLVLRFVSSLCNNYISQMLQNMSQMLQNFVALTFCIVYLHKCLESCDFFLQIIIHV